MGKKKSLRKAMKNSGGFLRRGKEKPKGPPGEIKPKPPKKHKKHK